MKIYKLLFIAILFISCSSVNHTSTTEYIKSDHINSSKVMSILQTADLFRGTPYQYAGTTKEGMDCSGLVYTVFNQHNIDFPRISREQAKMGEKVKRKKIKKGDLLFFATGKKGRVSHVGIVHHIKNKEVIFIHSSSSRGVILSSLESKYWNKAFLFAKRVL